LEVIAGMNYGISTSAFVDEPLTPSLLDRLLRGGFTQIELFANRPHFDLHLPFFEETRPGQGRPLSAVAHSERDRSRSIDEIKRALELTDRIHLSHVVTHLGVPQQAFTPILFEHAYTLIRTISEFADVCISVENIPNDISSPERIREFLTLAQRPDVGICYDSGHGSLQGSALNLDKVTAIHLNDNGNAADDHLWPFAGTLNWPEFIAELARVEFRGPIVFEVDDTHIERGCEVSERLEALLAKARSAPAEFRQQHSLKADTDEDDLH
jgi:sugar phosphate isomerase/epimerase